MVYLSDFVFKIVLVFFPANDFDGVAASIIFSGSGEIEEQVVNVTVVNDDDVESTEIFVVGLEAVNTVDRLRIPAVDLCSIVNDDGVGK